MGFVPLFRDCGNYHACLYYYRTVENPLLAVQASVGTLYPLDDAIDGFLSDPDRYEDHGSFKRGRRMLPGWDAPRIEDSGNPLEQLLKPLDVLENQKLFEKEHNDRILHSDKSHVFERLLNRLQDLEDPDESTESVKRAFQADSYLKDWFRWYRLGCRLIDLGDWTRAVAVLSNARVVALETGPMWSKVAMIAQKLLAAVTPAGPLLYQRQVGRWMPWLKEWQSGEKARVKDSGLLGFGIWDLGFLV